MSKITVVLITISIITGISGFLCVLKPQKIREIIVYQPVENNTLQEICESFMGVEYKAARERIAAEEASCAAYSANLKKTVDAYFQGYVAGRRRR